LVTKTLSEGRSVIVDRTNVDAGQVPLGWPRQQSRSSSDVLTALRQAKKDLD